MSGTTIGAIKELRAQTGAGIMECRAALDEAQGHFDQALVFLRARAVAEAAKREDREAAEGVVGVYRHHTGRLAALVELSCETDFVARTAVFGELAQRLAEQVAATDPNVVDRADLDAEAVDAKRADFADQARAEGKPDHLVEKIVTGRLEKFYQTVALLDQPWIREPERSVSDLVKEASGRLGERVVVRRFSRLALGEGGGR